MSTGLKILLGAGGAVFALAFLFSRAFVRRPLRSILAGGIQGACALAAVNITGAFTGISLGVNLFSGAVCLLFGVPGVVSLLLSNILFQL